MIGHDFLILIIIDGPKKMNTFWVIGDILFVVLNSLLVGLALPVGNLILLLISTWARLLTSLVGAP
jgi:hypothetical protein